ncbi:T9SS type A sorting domain-containing protein [Flavobacterium sp.]|uniref:T9SS type A sorting domain-containing protein n=1 Tax=Flavobacterium sp. TaxID=239 RepID=UPI0037508965
MKTKLFLTMMLLFIINLTNAQVSGDLDTTFGTNGKVNTNFGQADFIINSQVIQSDGKIILCGSIQNYSVSYGFVIRLNADGSLDSSFNTNGKTINETIDSFDKILIQTDGKIIVGGSKSEDVALARYNSNGTLDTSFDIDGMIFNINNAFNNRRFVDLDLQTDGKIVVLSEFNSGSQDFRILRYLTNGSIDTTFGNNGSVTTDIGNVEFPKSIIVQSDSKILVGGTTYNSSASTDNPFIARYTSTGLLDNTFNSNGKRIYSFTGASYNKISNLVVQTDGKIVFYSKTFISSSPKILLVRLNSNSSYDTTFDTDGIAIATSPNNFEGENAKLRIQSNGKYTLFTTIQPIVNNVSNNDILGLRFNTNGTLDSTFDSDGILIISYFSLNDNFGDFSCVGNSIIISGNTEESLITGKIAVAKLTQTASFDTTFDTDGKLFFTFPYGSSDETFASEIQPDGKILVAGFSYFNNKDFYTITRYNSNGSIDTNFGTNGLVVINNTRFGTPNDIAIDTNGKIIIVGRNYKALIVRLNSNGSLDTTFGTNGFANFSTSDYSSVNDLKILSNGKILIAGYEAYTIGTTFSGNFMLARLNANGTTDTTFGTNGISNLGSTFADQEVLDKIEVQSDGKIVAAGTINNGSDLDIVIFRYNSNGTFDTTFNGNGSTTFASSGSDRPNGLAIQNDGKIIILGQLNSLVKIARFTSSGAIDLSFDSDGIIDVNSNDMDYSNALRLTQDQKIFIIGSTTLSEINVDFSTLKFNSNGSLDTTFANSGKLTTDFFSDYDEATSILITNDNKLILCGIVFAPNNNSIDFGLAKYYLDSNLSNNETQISKSNLFYPNPAENTIYLNETVKTVKLFTIQGKEIVIDIKNNSVDTSNLNAGIYLLQLELENNKVINTKLIKN